MNRAEVLDMVGSAFDETWIDTDTALDLLREYAHVTRDRALAMLCGLDQAPAVDEEATLDQHVTRIGDLLDAGRVTCETAIRMLADAADLSYRLAADLLRADTHRRACAGDDWTPLREWRDDGSWS